MIQSWGGFFRALQILPYTPSFSVKETVKVSVKNQHQHFRISDKSGLMDFVPYSVLDLHRNMVDNGGNSRQLAAIRRRYWRVTRCQGMSHPKRAEVGR